MPIEPYRVARRPAARNLSKITLLAAAIQILRIKARISFGLSCSAHVFTALCRNPENLRPPGEKVDVCK